MHRSRPDDLIVGPAILFAPANRPDIIPGKAPTRLSTIGIGAAS